MHSPHSRSRQAARAVLNVVADDLLTWLHTGQMPDDTSNEVTAIIADAINDAVQTAINDIRLHGE